MHTLAFSTVNTALGIADISVILLRLKATIDEDAGLYNTTIVEVCLTLPRKPN